MRRPLSKNNNRDGDFLGRVECYEVFERCCDIDRTQRLELLLELLLELQSSNCPEVGVLPCPVAPLLTVSECANPTSI